MNFVMIVTNLIYIIFTVFRNTTFDEDLYVPVMINLVLICFFTEFFSSIGNR